MSPAVAYEMLVSHSPPVFSHSPPNAFLSDYASFRLSQDMFLSQSPRGAFRSPSPLACRPISFAPKMTQISALAKASPKRPCLIVNRNTSMKNNNNNSNNSSSNSTDDDYVVGRSKKRVVFADDKGMALTHVRVMTEPSNVPPLWSCKFLAEVTQGISAEPEAEREPWEITFAQPASDYIDFRKKLDTKKVSLENVIVKEADEQVVGTIKVSNLSFSKEVILRSSSDSWRSHEDTLCTYVPNSTSGAPVYVLYDTFSFKVPTPQRAARLEFCVCFRCDGQEYWDNNDGKNYVLAKKVQRPPLKKSFSCSDVFRNRTADQPKVQGVVNVPDAVHAKLDTWSEFASWQHLENSKPYW